MIELATRVLDIPRLYQDQWRRLLAAVAGALNEPGVLSLAEREKLATSGCGTLHICTSYVIEGLRLGEYDLTAAVHAPDALAACFSDSLTKLAQAAQMEFSASDTAVIRDWFSGGSAPVR